MNLLDRLSDRARTVSAARPLPEDSPLPERFVTSIVDQMDRIPENIRVATSGYTHVSALTSFCGRRSLLMQQQDRQSLRSVTGGERVMWRIGRAVESHIREQYLAARNNQNVLGRWTCLCGKALHVGLHNSSSRCNDCNSPLNVYGEFTLRDEEAKIVGNPDLLILHESSVVVSEIKSMKKDQWELLTAPLPDHVFQAGMYHDLLKRQAARYRVHSTGVFIYCTKDYKHGSPYKEFHVDFTKPSLVAIREMIRNSVLDALHAQQTQDLVPRTVCASPNCAMAKACPVATVCFNLP